MVEKSITLWAENRTQGDSSVVSSTALGIWCCNSAAPLEKWGGEDVGKDEPVANATGCGVAGEVRKGTAAGLTGEVKTGGPGGVLK